MPPQQGFISEISAGRWPAGSRLGRPRGTLPIQLGSPAHPAQAVPSLGSLADPLALLPQSIIPAGRRELLQGEGSMCCAVLCTPRWGNQWECLSFQALLAQVGHSSTAEPHSIPEIPHGAAIRVLSHSHPECLAEQSCSPALTPPLLLFAPFPPTLHPWCSSVHARRSSWRNASTALLLSSSIPRETLT